MAKSSVDPADTSPLSVQTVDSKGKAPKRRMSTPSAAWSAYTKQKQGSLRRDARYGDIAGIHAGFPPTPPVQNERSGQSDMPNINTKQFTAKLNTYVSTWTAINAQGDGFAEILARHDDPMEAERRGKVQTEEFNEAIRLWDGDDEYCFESGSQYTLISSARDTQMGMYGLGFSFFRDSIDFRFRMVPTRQVLIPDGTLLTMENCPAMFIEDKMSVTELYEMCGKPGWNEDGILRCLYEHVEMTSPGSGRRASYAEWVNEIRNNDTWILSEFLPVSIVHGYVKEFDGSITHVTFTDLYGSGKGSSQKDSKKDAESFIYEKTNVAKRWQQVIVPFADNAGPECDWHGVKGFGDLIFDGCHLNNQMFNRAAMGGVMTNLLMFRGSGENDAQKMDQMTFTQFGMMAPGLEIEQIRFQADIEGALAVLGMGSQLLSENTRISPQNEKTTTSEQPTATQVTADRADRAQFTTLQIAIYRAVGLDVLFSEMYRRIAQPGKKYPESWAGGKIAKRFRENCEKRGIPEEDLLKIKCVRANRNIGSGDLALDLMKGKELLGVATPGRGQLNARKEIVAALKGVEMVGAFVEEVEPPPAEPEWALAIENNLIQLGQAPQAIGAQDQERHVVSHLQLLGGAAQVASQLMEVGVQQQTLEGAKKLNNALVAGIQHVEQHVALMSEMPRTAKQPTLYENFVNMTTKQLHNLQQISDSFAEDIQKSDVAAQPQPSPEMMKAQEQIRIEDMKAQADIARDDLKTKAKLGESAVKSQGRVEMQMLSHQQKLEMESQKNQQQMGEKTAQTVQDLMNKQAEAQQNMEIAQREGEVRIEQKRKEAKTKKPK